jgi:hypothetical protein
MTFAISAISWNEIRNTTRTGQLLNEAGHAHSHLGHGNFTSMIERNGEYQSPALLGTGLLKTAALSILKELQIQLFR